MGSYTYKSRRIWSWAVVAVAFSVLMLALLRQEPRIGEFDADSVSGQGEASAPTIEADPLQADGIDPPRTAAGGAAAAPSINTDLGAGPALDGAAATEAAAAPLWRRISEASVSELPPGFEEVSTRVLVSVDLGEPDWRVGSRVSIPIPHTNRVYTPMIVELKDHGKGLRTWIGLLEGEIPRRFTITRGEDSLFAHLPTPEGTYELVATGETGWLMPSADMAPDVDYSVSDVVVLEPEILLEAPPREPRP